MTILTVTYEERIVLHEIYVNPENDDILICVNDDEHFPVFISLRTKEEFKPNYDPYNHGETWLPFDPNTLRVATISW